MRENEYKLGIDWNLKGLSNLHLANGIIVGWMLLLMDVTGDISFVECP